MAHGRSIINCEMKKLRESRNNLVINDDFSYISPADGKTYKMTILQKLFCDHYLEFKGDGVNAVFKAGYNVKNAKEASAISWENLQKPNLIAYINHSLEEAGFNDDNVYKQHLFLVNQHADFPSKAKAIDMFYKLKGNYAPEKSVNLNIEVEASNEIKDLAKKVNDVYRGTSVSSNGGDAGAVGIETPNKE